MSLDTLPASLGVDGAAGPWAEFRVADGAERLQLLKALRDGSVPITLSAPGGVSMGSQLWSLDATQGQLSFSAEADIARVQRLVQGDEAVAVAYLDHVKLQFDLVDLVLVRGTQGSALRARLPAQLYRFQRRTGYRVRTFERSAPQARLRHPSLPDMQLQLRIVDVSVGGCALVLPDDVPALQPGTDLRDSRIDLDADTRFHTTLRLQHVSAMHGGGPGLRLGCAFAGLDGTAQRSLQRYVDHTQQRRRLLSLR